jgi:hypothetical protein
MAYNAFEWLGRHGQQGIVTEECDHAWHVAGLECRGEASATSAPDGRSDAAIKVTAASVVQRANEASRRRCPF